MGGRVLLGPGFENLCRRARPDELEAIPELGWVVEAQGLPNLVHEFIHALFLGALADDHGFDYGEIPLDMERPDQRRHLWEEMVCCGASAAICAPLHPSPSAFVRDWFVEQFEIQGVFHGLEHDLDAFRAHIDRQMQREERLAELDATVDRAYALLDAAMAEVGGPALPRCDLRAIWRDYRDLHASETHQTLVGSHSGP